MNRVNTCRWKTTKGFAARQPGALPFIQLGWWNISSWFRRTVVRSNHPTCVHWTQTNNLTFTLLRRCVRNSGERLAQHLEVCQPNIQSAARIMWACATSSCLLNTGTCLSPDWRTFMIFFVCKWVKHVWLIDWLKYPSTFETHRAKESQQDLRAMVWFPVRRIYVTGFSSVWEKTKLVTATRTTDRMTKQDH